MSSGDFSGNWKKWVQADKKTDIVVLKQWLTFGVGELSSLMAVPKPDLSRFVEKKFDKLQICAGMLPLNAADRLYRLADEVPVLCLPIPALRGDFQPDAAVPWLESAAM